MNSWSRRRKRIILAILFAILIVLVGLPMFLLFYQKPTCFDNKQNGDEKGVDCGGSCQLLCTTESLPLIMNGDPRVLLLATSTYQVIALVENSNNTAEIYKAGYTIKIFDAKSSIPLKTIDGSAYVPKASTFAVFEGPITLEAGVLPTRATLEWKAGTLVWQKNASVQPELSVKDLSFSRLDSAPKLEAIVENPTLNAVSNIDLSAVLFDAEGNIFAVSKTYVEELKAGEEVKVVFTWPRAFASEPAKTDVLIRVYPDRSFLR